jgi:RHS repeat-associated protein
MALTITSIRRSFLARMVTLATLASFLATFLPPRVARADDTSAPPLVADGGFGLAPGAATVAADAVGVTGSARTSYRFALPTARGDAQPSLALTYDSSLGVGFAGMGWTLNLPSIVRKGTSGIPRFQDPVPYGAQGGQFAGYSMANDPNTDDFYIDGQLLLLVQDDPPLPTGFPPNLPPAPGVLNDETKAHTWMLYRREIDDGTRYFFDGLTWVQQTKAGHLRQFGTPFDGGAPSVEQVDYKTFGARWATNQNPGFSNVIYRWNLVRDTDASGNTVYYVWDGERQLLGVNPQTAGTMFLTDIYDTSSTPNPVPLGGSSGSTGSCPGPATQSCGNCGTQTGFCDNGVWAWSGCVEPTTAVCAPGETFACPTGGVRTCLATCQYGDCEGPSCVLNGVTYNSQATATVPCGSCGSQTLTCDNGSWTSSACVQPGTCPGESCTGPAGQSIPNGGSITQPCLNCGTQTGTCSSGVLSWSACAQSSTACSPGVTQACRTGGTQTCDPSTCTWGPCTGQACSLSNGQLVNNGASQTAACGYCGTGTSTSTCQNGTWSPWSTCVQPASACSPNTTQVCGGNGTRTCSSSCSWSSCVCPSGYTFNGSVCQQNITGSLIDGVLGLLEKSAYAQTPPPPPPPSATFAHHVHLTWYLPQFPAYPTQVTTNPGLVGPYAFSPIWKAPPFAQLTTVDVFSATQQSTDRQLVREYKLSYTTNLTQTRSFLRSIQLIGDCDSMGGISEATFAPPQVDACKSKELMPPTTFTYYGVPAAAFTPSSPAIVAETDAYTVPAPPDFLVDLNGDAISDLVTGNFGYTPLMACQASRSCSCNTGCMLEIYLSLGFLGSPTCSAPCTNPVVGPTQSPGAFSGTLFNSNYLKAYWVDDAMWSFSAFADWGATGKTSFLELAPNTPVLPPDQTYSYSNPNPPHLFLGQLSSEPTLFLQPLPVPIADVQNFGSTLAYQDPPCNHSSVGCYEDDNLGAYNISNAIDLDGDGLPDLSFLPTALGLNYLPIAGGPTLNPQVPELTALFSSRDHNGITHPFSTSLPVSGSEWTNPTWRWPFSDFSSPGGTFGVTFDYNHGPAGQVGLPVTHALADVDGDGLLDEVAANFFSADWNSQMPQFVNVDYHIQWQGSAGGAPIDYAGIVVLPNRGDGRFGVPLANAGPRGDVGTPGTPMVLPQWADSNYITPGASAPFAPYASPSLAVNPNPPADGGFTIGNFGLGWGSYYVGTIVQAPPYNTGPIPPPQSDPLNDPQPGVAPGWPSYPLWRFGDLNGDGLADYAFLDPAGIHICLRYGGAWDSAHWKCVTEPKLASGSASSNAAPATIMIGDLTASGMNRVIYFPPQAGGNSVAGAPAVAISVSQDGSSSSNGTIHEGIGQPRDGLLQSIGNSAGALTTFSYQTLHSLGIGDVPVPAWVVTSVKTSNMLTGTQAVTLETDYAYDTPIYDARYQTLVGFRSVTASTSGDPSGNSPGIKTKTTFATQTDLTCLSAGCAATPEALLHFSRSLPIVVETSENSAGGRRLSTTTHTYALNLPWEGVDGRWVVSLGRETTVTYPWDAGENATTGSTGAVITYGFYGVPGISFPVPASGGLASTVLEQQRIFDGNGNELFTIDYGVVNVDTPIIRHRTWSLPPGDTTGWSYRVATSTVGYGSGTTIDTSLAYRELDFFYDSAGRLLQETTPLTGGRPLPGPSGGSRAAGQPSAAVLANPTLLLASYQYDAMGNVVGVGNQDLPCTTASLSDCVATTAYDTQFGYAPVSVTTYPNGSAGPGLTTNIATDWRLEKVTSTVDPAQRMAVTRYDDFGRVVEVDQPNILMPGATTQVLTASYVDTGPVRTVMVHTGYGPDQGTAKAFGYASHYRYVDGLGETRAVVDQVDPSVHQGQGWILSGVHNGYANGRVAMAYQPTYTAAPVVGVLPAEVQMPAATTPSATAVYDALGRTVSATDFNKSASQRVYRDAELSVDYSDPEQFSGTHPLSHTTTTSDGHGRVAQVDRHWNAAPWGSAGGTLTQYTYQSTGERTTIQQSTYGGGAPQGPGSRSLGWTGRSLVYDSLGRMIQNSEPNVGTWTYAYDAEGRLVGTSDARGCGENIYYDPGGRILAADYSPCGGAGQAGYTSPTIAQGTFPYPDAEESYAYDPNTGFLTNAADRGRSDLYIYDAAGHVAQINRQMSVPGSPGVYGAVHQENFDQFSLYGQVLTRRMNGVALGASGTLNETTSYTMDGRVAEIDSVPLGTLVSNTQYDASERMTTMTLGQLGTSAAGLGPPVASYTYDPNGALYTYRLQRSANAGTASDAGYVAPPAGDHSLLTTFMDATILRDMVGNPVTVTDKAMAGWPNGSPSGSQSYKYYDDYRIHTFTSTADATGVDPGIDPYAYEHSTGSPLYPPAEPPISGQRAHQLSFAYDGRGNITNSSDGADDDFFNRSLGTVAPFPYDGFAGDQITSATSPSGGSLSIQYDAAGNITSLGTTNGNPPIAYPSTYGFSWDELGNLAHAVRADPWGSGTVDETFTYAAGGQRTSIARSLNGQDPTYTVSIFDALVLKDAQFNGDYEDDASKEHIYLAGGLVHVFADASGTTHTFLNLPDPLGSSAFVVDQGTGELVEQTSYLPYGGLDSDWRNPHWGSPREDVKFTGQWDNAEVGLVYMNARYYSPQLGRFISPDPLTIHGLAGDPNPYEYGYGNPIVNVDPTGLGPPSPETPDTQKSDEAMGARFLSPEYQQMSAQEVANLPSNATSDFNGSNATASDALGGLASDFETGGALSDFTGLPGPSWLDRSADVTQEFTGAASMVWNMALDSAEQGQNAAMGPPGLLLHGLGLLPGLSGLHAPMPQTAAGRDGYLSAAVGMFFIPGPGEAEVLEEGSSLLQAAEEYQLVRYGDRAAGFENHHGILDKWLSENVPGYVSRAKASLAIRLSEEHHAATKAVFREWLEARTGRPVGGVVDWTTVTPREIYTLSEKMFDAAKVPAATREQFYSILTSIIYGL